MKHSPISPEDLKPYFYWVDFVEQEEALGPRTGDPLAEQYFTSEI